MAVSPTRVAAYLVIAACSWQTIAYAAPKTYLTGTLLSIVSPESSVPLPLPSGQILPVPIHLRYQFEIQLADVVYVGYCQTRDYKAEWQVGKEVQFRMKKDKIYLKRANGKEFALQFLLQAKIGPDGKPVTIFGQHEHPLNLRENLPAVRLR